MARTQQGPKREPGVKHPPNTKPDEYPPAQIERGLYDEVEPPPEAGGGLLAEGFTYMDARREIDFCEKKFISWKKIKSRTYWMEVLHWKKWIKWGWWHWYLGIIVAGALVALVFKYNDQILEKLRPMADKAEAVPGGFMIPIVVLCAMSFPPIFGLSQEIIILLVGAVWGLWIGMGITATGTASGDLGTFYAFKYLLRDRAKRMREDPKNPSYGMLEYMVQEEKYILVLLVIIRYSAIPGPVSTAIFASCDVKIWWYLPAIIISLPKQLIVVYLGVIFADGEDAGSSEKIITYSSLSVAIVLTAWSAWYIYAKMKRIRILMWRRRQVGMDPLFPQRKEEKVVNDDDNA